MIEELDLTKNKSEKENLIIREKMRNRINFYRNTNKIFVLKLISAEPEKATRIINSLTRQSEKVLIAEIINTIDNEKIKIEKILIDIKKKYF